MDENLKHGFRIGPFTVAPLAGRVDGPNGSRHVQPKVMDVLMALACRPGELVERDSILERVWGRATSDEVLTRCISELRSALGDESGTPKFIQTIPKRGYCLLQTAVFPVAADLRTPRTPGADGAAGGPTPPGTNSGHRLTALLVDDHTLVREGLKLQLQELDESMVCLEAGSCEEALTFAGREVDLVLLDFGLPGLQGLEAIAKIKSAFTAPVTIVSATDDAPTIRSAIAQGAMGFIPKTMSKREFFAALGVVRAGGIYLPAQVLFTPRGTVRKEPSESQRDVLSRVLRGMDDAAIADELNVAEREVAAHLRSAYESLGVDNRIDAVYELARRGLRIAASGESGKSTRTKSPE